MSTSSLAPSAPSRSAGVSAPVERADVIVVGAGPGGSATAAYLADHGRKLSDITLSARPVSQATLDAETVKWYADLGDVSKRFIRVA